MPACGAAAPGADARGRTRATARKGPSPSSPKRWLTADVPGPAPAPPAPEEEDGLLAAVPMAELCVWVVRSSSTDAGFRWWSRLAERTARKAAAILGLSLQRQDWRISCITATSKMNGAPADDGPVIHLALPKGHMQENIFKLLEEAGMKVSSAERVPTDRKWRCSDPSLTRNRTVPHHDPPAVPFVRCRSPSATRAGTVP
jgi:hypothetical protein